jgi:hypothetical protein
MTATATPTRKGRKVTPATDANAAKEASVLAGVNFADKPGPEKAPVRKASGTPKAAPAPKAEKAPKTLQEKLTRPASKTVVAYVEWLKGNLGAAEYAKLAKTPDRLAEVALQNYGLYQASKR